MLYTVSSANPMGPCRRHAFRNRVNHLIMYGDQSSDPRWMRRAVKTVVKILFGGYRINRIYRLTAARIDLPVSPTVILQRIDAPLPAAAVDPKLLERFSYAGDDAYGFGLFVSGELACLCWFWGQRRFNDPLLWMLEEDEAILVDIMTTPKHRGRGFGALLVSYAANEMLKKGMRRLYTWMWHTHRASVRTFEKAGWSQIAWVVEIHPFGMSRPLRIRWWTR